MQYLQPITDALLSPVWNSIYVIFFIIVTIISTVLKLRLKEKKEISYSVITDTPVSVKEAVAKDFEIYFKGKPVKNVRLVELKIWNSGNVEIKKAHYDEPISFLPDTVDREGKLLDIEVIDKHPKYLSIKQAVLYHKEGVIGLPEVLFQKGYSVTLKILLADYAPEITVSASIQDLDRIKEIKNNEDATYSLREIVLYFLVGLILTFLLASFLTSILKLNASQAAIVMIPLYIIAFFWSFLPHAINLLPKQIRDKLYVKQE
jgi:hypothetical protein